MIVRYPSIERVIILDATTKKSDIPNLDKFKIVKSVDLDLKNILESNKDFNPLQ